MLQSNISGCVAARNSVKFGYPLRQCIEALRPICDEVVLAYDPTTEDGTYELAQQLRDELDIVLFESPWDMLNMKKGLEIGHQSQVAVDACSPATEWRLCVQQDEAFHENDHEKIWSAITFAEEVDAVRNWSKQIDNENWRRHFQENFQEITGFDFVRPYFYGNLHTIRCDWSVQITRLTRKGRYTYDGFDGQNSIYVGIGEPRNYLIDLIPSNSIEIHRQMDKAALTAENNPTFKAQNLRPQFPEYVTQAWSDGNPAWLYHYSRIGDPDLIAKRVRNVDSFFHAEENLPKESELPPYDFTTREYDSYAFTENPKETNSELEHYPGTHPRPFAKLYQEFE